MKTQHRPTPQGIRDRLLLCLLLDLGLRGSRKNGKLTNQVISIQAGISRA